MPAKLVMSWIELNLCGAADAGGVDGKNIIRASATWSVSSHPTVMDVLFALCAPWTAHCCIRRNGMHVTMSAALKPQRNTIFRKQHRLLCGPIQKEEMHTYLTQVLPPRSTPTYAIQPNPITPHTSVPSHTIHLLVTMLRTKTWNFFVLDASCLSHSLSPSLFSSSIYPEVCSAIPHTN